MGRLKRRPRLGRRGAALLVFAALDAIYGIRLATVDPGTQEFYDWLAKTLPMWVSALVWLTIGACCLLYAFLPCDRPAFSAAIGIKVLWGTLYLGGWIIGDVADGWVSTAIWLAFACCVGLIASWPEPVSGRGDAWTPPSP